MSLPKELTKLIKKYNRITHYKYDKISGMAYFARNRDPGSSYRDEKWDGLYRRWRPSDGSLMEESYYRNGTAHGLSRLWSKDRSLTLQKVINYFWYK